MARLSPGWGLMSSEQVREGKWGWAIVGGDHHPLGREGLPSLDENSEVLNCAIVCVCHACMHV